MNRLFWRALAAFLALPVVVALLVPWLIRSLATRSGGGSPLGVPVALVGAAVLLACVRDFYVAGRGTLAPWDPPRHLVVVGLYRYTRNPMYQGVLLLVAGQALLAGSWAMALYTGFLAVAFHVRVTTNEEPFLATRFGDEWVRYRNAVPRWAWRRRPYAP